MISIVSIWSVETCLQWRATQTTKDYGKSYLQLVPKHDSVNFISKYEPLSIDACIYDRYLDWATFSTYCWCYSWASCHIRNIAGLRMLQECRDSFLCHHRLSDRDIHHGTCMTPVPWCRPGLLTGGFPWRGGWENISGIPSACATRTFTYLARGPLGQVTCRFDDI